MTLRMIDTFSGIGGFSLAARWLGGIETVQFVEREPYCQRILRKHWPDIPIHDDICTYEPERGSADIICGGFPCQDISQAGKGAGLSGERSGLFYELLRVVRLVGPRYVALENVAAILSRGLDDVLGALAEAGYDCEWACIPASAVGACHQRDRWWCVAYASGANRRRWSEGAGWGLSSSADACDSWIPEGGGGADSIAHAQGRRRGARPGQGEGQGGHEGTGVGDGGGTGQQHGESGGRAVPEPQDGDWSDAPHTHHTGPQGWQPTGVRQHTEQWPSRPGDSQRCRLNPDWRGYVSEPVLRRGDDGLSGRVDRLKALGNAVVPQVAMVPLARVLELESATGYRL